MSRRVYLDHNASTPVHPEVLAEMLPFFSDVFGNPSSVHAFGRAAREAVDAARERIAGFLSVRPDDVVFTSGGTESDNFGIKGLALARGRGHLITSRIEHHAVLRTCETLEGQGFNVTYLPVDEQGRLDPDDVKRAIRPDTIAISVMHANSETGTIQPIAEIGALAREREVTLHVDAVQTFGKIPIDVEAMGIGAMSFSGHKIYGPKGIAGLYIRRGTKMVAIQHGGEHERRRRAGTENTAGIVGLGKAVEIRASEMGAEAERLTALRERLWQGIRSRIPEVRLNGERAPRLPGTANIVFHHVESESIVLGLDLKGIAVSAGSACTSGNVEPSYVLVAMGLPWSGRWAPCASRSDGRPPPRTSTTWWNRWSRSSASSARRPRPGERRRWRRREIQRRRPRSLPQPAQRRAHA